MNTETKIYNDMSVRDILKNLPQGILKTHRNEYISNCIEIHKQGNCQLSEHLRFRNVVMIQYYNSPKFVFKQKLISRDHAKQIEMTEQFNTINN